MTDETYRGLLENISETSGTYKQMLQAIAEGGGGGGSSGLCVLTDGILDKSYNDLLRMVHSGIIPFIFHSNGYLYFLSSCDINEDGISFKENAYNSTVILFYAPDGDPDANLHLD